MIANGNINPNAAEFLEGSTYAQRNQVFENLGNGKFREDKATGMDGVRVSRGLAVGDLDGDGDLDVALNNSNEPCEVYENVGAGAGHWLQVDFAAPAGNRFAIGARLELEAAGLKKQIRDVKTASSYASQNALAVHFGLGKAEKVDRLTVRRPGKVQVFEGLPADRKIDDRVREPIKPAPKGRLLKSLGFQPQAGGVGPASSPGIDRVHLGLKPQVREASQIP